MTYAYSPTDWRAILDSLEQKAEDAYDDPEEFAPGAELLLRRLMSLIMSHEEVAERSPIYLEDDSGVPPMDALRSQFLGILEDWYGNRNQDKEDLVDELMTAVVLRTGER